MVGASKALLGSFTLTATMMAGEALWGSSSEYKKKESSAETLKIVPKDPECEVFLVQKEANKTASVFEDWKRKKQEDEVGRRNVDFWKTVERECNGRASGNKKIYVSFLGNKLTFLTRHQSMIWTIVKSG